MPTVNKTIKKVEPKIAVKKAPVAVKKAEVKEVMVKETGLKQSVYDLKGAVSGSIELPAEIFGAKVNKTLMTQAVRVYLANKRRGTLSTNSRGEVKIIGGLEKIEPKTNKMVDVIKKLGLDGKKSQMLLVMPRSGSECLNVTKAARNIKGVTVMGSNLINTYEVLSNKRILFMKDAIEGLKETFLK